MMMESRSGGRGRGLGRRAVAGAAVAVGLFGLIGCEVEIGPIIGGEAITGDETTALVRFVNQTNHAVRVEFYATNEQMDELPADLFADQNLIETGIGTGGTGVIGPLATDEITLDCTSNLVLGTSGGVFLDNETGYELGEGTRQYTQSTLTLCGRLITFTYFRADGAYQTVTDID